MRALFVLSATFLLSGCITDPGTTASDPTPSADAGQRPDGGQQPDAGPLQPDAGLVRDLGPGPRPDATIADAAVPDDPCALLCDRAAECLELERDECQRLCPSLAPERHACVLDAPECADMRACFAEPERPGPVEICDAVCERQAGCVAFVCAPGTLPDAWADTCYSDCLAQPPEQAEIQQLFAGLCAEVVADVRAFDDAIDGRCDAEAEAFCPLLCDDRILGCAPDLDRGACIEACEFTWNDTNLTCLQQAEACPQINACFGDPEGQAACEDTCDHLQNCLLEACPPRTVPPILTTRCAAGCLNDPPAENRVDAYLALECSQVRQLVYRGNPELRPICEGGREFHPSPDECVAFCDNALQGCLGVGGRQFCLAGCAAISRDAYVCALEAQGDCQQIQVCLDE
jgi:hypothetical protein